MRETARRRSKFKSEPVADSDLACCAAAVEASKDSKAAARIVHDYNQKKIAQERQAAAAKKANRPSKVAAANRATAKPSLSVTQRAD